MELWEIRVFLKEWCNKLETHQYENQLVFDCLTSVKLLKSECDCEDANSEVDQQILSLLHKIIFNAQVGCFIESFCKTAIYDILSALNPASSFLFLTSLINELRPGFRLDLVLGLLEQYFIYGSYQALVLQQSKTFQLPCNYWNQIIFSVSSLPELVANRFESKIKFSFYHHQQFFLFIGLQMVEILKKLVKKVQEQEDVDTLFFANNISQFCQLGKTEFLFKPFIPFLAAKTYHCFVWQSVCQKMFQNCTNHSLDKLLFYLYKHAPRPFCLHRILGDIVVKNPKAKFIVLHKLFLTHYSCDCTVACNVIGYLAFSSTTRHLLYEVLLKLLTVWSLPSSIKHTSYEQHRYLTAAVLVCAVHMKNCYKNQQSTEIRATFMEGVKNHLESPDVKIRNLGMLVGEKISDLIKLGENEILKFDYNKTEDVCFLLSLCHVDDEPSDSFYNDQMKLYENIKKEINTGLSNTDEESSYSVDKRSFIKMAESSRINLPPADDMKEPNLTLADSVDSDDDLAPYSLPEETPFSKIGKPMYIRDCLDGLIENKDHEHMVLCLKCVEELIKSDPFAAKEVAVELCKVLINLQNNYAIDDFGLLQRKAIVSLLVCDPKKVAAYLTGEFYSEHYTLQQRMEILDALVMAAGQIGGLEKKEEIFVPEKNDFEVHKTLPWQQVVEKRIKRKTKRYGKTRKVLKTSPDQFGPVAGYFFYPLMAGYDQRIRTLDLVGTDCMVLGRLLYALGTILYSATNSTAFEDMALALFDFILQMRCHVEAFVRKACVYCLTMIALSARTLTQRLSDVAMNGRDWLCDVLSQDDDTEARRMASNCLAVINEKVKEELGANR